MVTVIAAVSIFFFGVALIVIAHTIRDGSDW